MMNNYIPLSTRLGTWLKTRKPDVGDKSPHSATTFSWKLTWLSLCLMFFTWQGVFAQYCAAGATSTSFEKISNVTFAGINNNSTATAGYEDFTSVTGNVVPGQTYAFSASFTGTSYADDQVLVWIDFNQDGDFEDAGELVLTTATGVSPWTGNITIPADAPAGNTRMRVRLHDSGLTPNFTPCGNSEYGQVEDYTISVASLSACSGQPDAGTASATPSSGAPSSTFTASATGISFGIGISYQWEYSTDNGGTWADVAGATTASSSITAIGTYGTTHYRLRIYCEGSDETSYSTETTYETVPVINVPATGNNSITTCSGTVYDNGGPSGDYGNNQNGYTVIYPSGSDNLVQVSGTSAGENCCDWIRIFDGVGTGGTQLWAGNPGGGTIPLTTSTTGPLTVQFTSDGSVTGAGFALTISCFTLPDCEGTPDAGIASVSPDSGNPGSSYTVSSSGHSVGLGLTYQWEYSLNEGSWTSVGTPSDTYANHVATAPANLGDTVQWRLVTTCTNSSESNTSAVATFTTVLVYCAPVYSSGCAAGARINDFSTTGAITNITNNGTGCSTGSYIDYSSTHSVMGYEGMVVNFNVGITNYDAGVKIWVDWNQDGEFEAGELMASSPSVITSGTSYVGSFTIPAGALLGTTKMRVRAVESSTTFDACSSYSWGEAEDYAFTVIELVDCSGTPDGGTASVSISEGAPGSTYTVSASGISFGLGLEYQWQSNTNDGGWVNVGSSSDTYSSYTATAPAFGSVVQWQLVTTCAFSSESNASSVATFTSGYCTSVPVNAGFNDGITNVVFVGLTNINNPSSADAGNEYSDFTHLSAEVAPGGSYPLSVYVSTDGDFTQHQIAWIDWNQNGIFEASERYDLGTATNVSNGLSSACPYSITVPVNAVTGSTRMRIQSIFSGNGLALDAFNSPCLNYIDSNNPYDGETEDYTIIVVPAPNIASISPTEVCGFGDTITVTGINFTGVTDVSVGSESAIFTVIDENTLTFIVPDGAMSGSMVSITNEYGTGTSTQALTIKSSPVVNPITGPDAFCRTSESNTFQLEVENAVGNDWSSSNESVATVSGGLVTAISAGEVTISFSVTDNGCTTTVTHDLVITEETTILSQTMSQTVVTGNTATFSIEATGSVTGYQWYYDGTPITDGSGPDGSVFSGTNTHTLTISNTSEALGWSEFYAEIFNESCGDIESEYAILYVGDTGIETDPSSVTLCSTGTGEAQFSVVASGDVDNYYWELDQTNDGWWEPIEDGSVYGLTFSGSDTDILSVSGITLTHNGWRFRVIVEGPANSAESNAAILSVTEGVSISSQPQSASVCLNPSGTQNFSVAASGAVTGYTWQYSADGVSYSNVSNNVPAGVTYSGQNTADLAVTRSASTPVGNYHYRVIVGANSPCATLTSDAAIMNVSSPNVEVSASSAGYCLPGDPVVLTASGAVNYTWSPADGLSATTGNVVEASPAVTTVYTVTGTDANGCISSTTVTVGSGNAVTASASSDLPEVCAEGDVQLFAGDDVPKNIGNYSFSVSSEAYVPLTDATTFAINGGGGSIDDGYSSTLNLGFTFNFGGTNYTQIRVNSNGAVLLGTTTSTSTTPFNSVNNVIAFNSRDLNNTGAVYSYKVDGVAPNRIFKVQAANFYRYNTTTHTGNAQVWIYETSNKVEIRYGAYNQSWTSANVQVGLRGASSAAANVLAVTSPTWAAITSSSVTNGISTTVNRIVQGTTNQVVSGTVFTFAPPPVTYSWTSEPEGFTSSEQNPVVNPSETTTYTVLVTDSASGCSDTAEVTINVVSGAVIDSHPVSDAVCAGENVSFSVEASGPGLTYQWRHNGVAIDGATADTLSLTGVVAGDAGSYDVVVTPQCGDAIISDAATLTVNAIPTAEASSNAPVCEGDTLNLSGSSDIGVTFEWTGPNGFVSNEQNPSIANVSSAAAGTYTFTAISAAGCSFSTTTTVAINANPEVAISPSSGLLDACVGEIKQLTASTVGSSTAVILSQNFEGSLDGWVLQNLSTGGSNAAATAWTLRQSPYSISSETISSNDASQFIFSNADVGGNGISLNTRLQSPAFSTVGYSSVNVSFYHYHRYLTNPQNVEYSLNGTDWVVLKTYSTQQGAPSAFVQDNIALPGAALNQPTVYVRFRFQGGWIWYWAIDNFEVTGTVSPEFTWSPTTNLYVDEQATVPYTGEPATTVYANVTGAGGTYTATSSVFNGCERSESVTLNVVETGCPSTTIIDPAQCGVTLTNIDDYVYATAVPGANGYRFRIRDLVTNEIQYQDKNLRWFRVIHINNYVFDRSYEVSVAVRIGGVWQPFFGETCIVTTPIPYTQLQESQCGIQINNLNDILYADKVDFAIGYKFRVINTLEPEDVQEFENPLRTFKMSLLTNPKFNTVYTVEVAVKNRDGSYLPYGDACTITTPLFPTTSLQDSQCEDYPVSSNTEILYADTYPGATKYIFRLENASLSYAQEVIRPLRTITLNRFSGLVPGENYTVRVAIELHGVIGPWGKPCTIITPGGDVDFTREETVVSDFGVVAYPNPFVDGFSLDVRSNSSSSVSVAVYDMTGRLLESRDIKVEDLSSQTIGYRYPSGVYNVVVTQDDEVRTVRVVKK